MGLRINVQLAKCGQCGKRYSNPLTHVCVNPRGRGPRVQVKPRVSYDCPKCGQPVTNPLTHICKTRTDFRKRLEREKKLRAARKRAKQKPRPQHDYHTCRDPDCQRRACVAYKEGIADCPREHT